MRTFRGLPTDELIEDFRLACTSRAIDDREISLQKQSKVYFQISGAGHEALLLGLARLLRPGSDWFFPYYRDLALMLGLGVTPTEILCQAVGSAQDPSSGGRQMPSHWGFRDKHVVTQSSPTGSQCIPAVGCAEAGRYIGRTAALSHLPVAGDEVTYVSLGEGATSEGEFWESLNTACTLHLPVVFVVADNGFAISVPVSDQSPAPVSELVQGFRGLEVLHLDGTDYFAVRDRGADAIAHVRAGVGPLLIHANVTRPYSHSSADTQSKYRSERELADEAERDPVGRLEHELVHGGVLSPQEASEIREQARQAVADAAKEALAAPRPDPATITEHVVALPSIPEPPDPGSGGDVVALGGAIHACSTSRWPPTRASGSSARTWPTPARWCSPTSRARAGSSVPPRPPARVRHGPLLQHAAGRGEHHRSGGGSGRPRAPSRAGDPVLRLHLARHATDQERGGHRPLALQRRILRARW